MLRKRGETVTVRANARAYTLFASQWSSLSFSRLRCERERESGRPGMVTWFITRGSHAESSVCVCARAHSWLASGAQSLIPCCPLPCRTGHRPVRPFAFGPLPEITGVSRGRSAERAMYNINHVWVWSMLGYGLCMGWLVSQPAFGLNNMQM